MISDRGAIILTARQPTREVQYFYSHFKFLKHDDDQRQI